jgi:hypothetical protein
LYFFAMFGPPLNLIVQQATHARVSGQLTLEDSFPRYQE